MCVQSKIRLRGDAKMKRRASPSRQLSAGPFAPTRAGAVLLRVVWGRTRRLADLRLPAFV